MITGNEPLNAFFKYNEKGYGKSIAFVMPDGSKHFSQYESGITLRQHFAAKAMQGMLSYNHRPDADGWGRIAEDAVLAADALIYALNKKSLNGNK